MTKKVAHLFPEVGKLDSQILGGKGLGLVEMQRLGLPVPPGFILPSGVSRAYLQEGVLPKRTIWHIRRAVAKLEKETGKRFGDPSNPLFLSVRSGAQVSLPGMMDSILNLGINDDTLLGLAEITTEDFALDTGSRFQRMFYEIVGEPAPENVWDQLLLAVQAVCTSWNNPRAKAYRDTNGIPYRLGTAIVVQSMVFGNASGFSGSGVVFSRDTITGEDIMTGEWVENAQGEDLVAGVLTPKLIQSLRDRSNQLFEELQSFVKKLELYYSDVVDVEFTIQEGKLYLLQVRIAKRTAQAAVKIAVDLTKEGVIDKKTAVARIDSNTLQRASVSQIDTHSNLVSIMQGIPASPGAAWGYVITDTFLVQSYIDEGKPVILVRPDTTAADYPFMINAAAIVTTWGGMTCHAALVARELGVPSIVGTGKTLPSKHRGEIVTVDGTTGQMFQGKLPMGITAPTSELVTFSEWRREFQKAPVVNFGLTENRYDVNTLLTEFYVSQALAMEALGTPFEEKVKEAAQRISSYIANVFLCYGILAVAGELKYLFSSVSLISSEEAADRAGRFGIVDSDTLDAQKSVQMTLQSTNEYEPFLAMAVREFRDSFREVSYCGGKKWSSIAACLLEYYRGEVTPSFFIDRMFHLRHNGGRLFDKHLMVTYKTDELCLADQLDAKHRHMGDALSLYNALSSPRVRYTFSGKYTQAKVCQELKELLEAWREFKETRDE